MPNLWLSSNEPDTYVDITDTMDTKLAALAEHVSQGTGEAEPWVRKRAEELAAQSGLRLHVRRGVQGAPVRGRRRGHRDERGSTDRGGPRRALGARAPRHRRGPPGPREDVRRVRAPGGQGRRDRLPGLRREPLLRVGPPAREPRAHARHRRAPDARARVEHPRGRVHPVGLRQGLHRRARGHRPGGRPPRSRSRPARGARRRSTTPPGSARDAAGSSARSACTSELLDRGVEEREARAMLVRAGYDPF